MTYTDEYYFKQHTDEVSDEFNWETFRFRELVLCGGRDGLVQVI